MEEDRATTTILEVDLRIEGSDATVPRSYSSSPSADCLEDERIAPMEGNEFDEPFLGPYELLRKDPTLVEVGNRCELLPPNLNLEDDEQDNELMEIVGTIDNVGLGHYLLGLNPQKFGEEAGLELAEKNTILLEVTVHREDTVHGEGTVASAASLLVVGKKNQWKAWKKRDNVAREGKGLEGHQEASNLELNLNDFPHLPSKNQSSNEEGNKAAILVKPWAELHANNRKMENGMKLQASAPTGKGGATIKEDVIAKQS